MSKKTKSHHAKSGSRHNTGAKSQTALLAVKKVRPVRYDAEQLVKSKNDIVKLNVGGNIFTTTKSTMCKFKNTYFSALFNGNYDIPLQEDGSIFIDRDGTHFRIILNFMRSGRIIIPPDAIIREEVLTEAEFYCLTDFIDVAESEQRAEKEKAAGGYWESNVIFIGKENINFADDMELKSEKEALNGVQCPDTTELVWKSIHDDAVTVIFQICHPSTAQNTDFSLKNIPHLLAKIASWERPNLRFVLVYDAGLTRELLKLSNEKFSNSSYVWYFCRGKLIECTLQWKLKYVGENIWKQYYFHHGDKKAVGEK